VLALPQSQQVNHSNIGMEKAIGNTPLKRSTFLSEKYRRNIYLKYEGCNPGGSSKDRIASFIIKSGYDNGLIHEDTTVVEASSGNTAIGLAMICQQKGLKFRVYVSKKCSNEKLKVLQGYSAEIILVDQSGGPELVGSTQYLAKQYCANIPNTFYCDQYFNPLNVEAHFQMTGPEIWRQTHGSITHFICGIGTGGTISGVGRYLKMKNPKIRIIGVEPIGSILKYFFYNHELDPKGAGKYLVEGIGKEFVPGCLHIESIDEIIQVADSESARAAHQLKSGTGYAPGFSGGAVCAGLGELADSLPINAKVVLLMADHGERYLSKLYNAEWLEANGLEIDIFKRGVPSSSKPQNSYRYV